MVEKDSAVTQLDMVVFDAAYFLIGETRSSVYSVQ